MTLGGRGKEKAVLCKTKIHRHMDKIVRAGAACDIHGATGKVQTVAGRKHQAAAIGRQGYRPIHGAAVQRHIRCRSNRAGRKNGGQEQYFAE